jgi:hypothetical protein
MTATQPADPLREALERIERRAAEQTSDTNAEPFEWCARLIRRAALGDHATLGLAWASVEAALPSQWENAWHLHLGARPMKPRYYAYAESGDKKQQVRSGNLDSPEAALLALHAALTEKKP